MTKKSYADMDPLEEIRAIKEEIGREFTTVHAYSEYLRKKYQNTDVAAEPKHNGNRLATPPAKSRTAKADRQPSEQRESSKRLTHA